MAYRPNASYNGHVTRSRIDGISAYCIIQRSRYTFTYWWHIGLMHHTTVTLHVHILMEYLCWVCWCDSFLHLCWACWCDRLLYLCQVTLRCVDVTDDYLCVRWVNVTINISVTSVLMLQITIMVNYGCVRRVDVTLFFICVRFLDLTVYCTTYVKVCPVWLNMFRSV